MTKGPIIFKELLAEGGRSCKSRNAWVPRSVRRVRMQAAIFIRKCYFRFFGAPFFCKDEGFYAT